MKISVIVSTYNAEEWLEKVLIGYNNQTYKNFELIVLDDCSKDETVGIVEKYQLYRLNESDIMFWV